MTTRRLFLLGAASLIAAPAVVRAESLMKIVVPKPEIITFYDSKNVWKITWGPSTEFIVRTSIPEGEWRNYWSSLATEFYPKWHSLRDADREFARA